MRKGKATDTVVRERVLYKDLIFRLVVCLIAAHIIIMTGQKFSSLHALTIPSYYPTLLINYAIALIIAYGVKRITMYLDLHYRWEDDIFKRAILQLLFGVITISLLSFFLVFLYFRAFGRNVMESRYPDFEFPFSVVLILCLNFFYAAYYYALRYIKIQKGQDVDPLEIKDESSGREIIVIDMAHKSVPVRVADISAVFLVEKTVFIWLNGMTTLSDCYGFNGNLSQIEDHLDKKQFFRINRQCLVNFNTVGAFSANGEKGLQLQLKPDLISLFGGKQEIAHKLCQVSNEKVSSFKKWMDR